MRALGCVRDGIRIRAGNRGTGVQDLRNIRDSWRSANRLHCVLLSKARYGLPHNVAGFGGGIGICHRIREPSSYAILK